MNFRTLLVWGASVAGIGGGAFSEPLLPEDISYPEVSTTQGISYYDGGLVESDGYHADFVMYASFDAKETAPVAVDGIQILFDAEQSADGILFLGLNEKKIVLIEEKAGEDRRSLIVPKEFHPHFLEDLQP